MKGSRNNGQSADALFIAALQKFSATAIGPILVAFIVLLCIWTFLIHWLIIFPGIWNSHKLLAVSVTTVHQILHIMLLCSLYRACTRDPGYIVVDSLLFSPDASRLCAKCNCVKEDRAHHCSTCRRCVRRMDHHCAFVNNCVGANNYKFFLLLLVYTTVGGLYNAAAGYVWHRAAGAAAAGDHLVAVGCNAAVIGAVALMMAPFAGFHLYLTARNVTTLELLQGRTGDYDVGPCRNARQTLGRHPALWLSPFHFDAAADSDAGVCV